MRKNRIMNIKSDLVQLPLHICGSKQRATVVKLSITNIIITTIIQIEKAESFEIWNTKHLFEYYFTLSII
jgi:hypothetical protein